MTLDAVTITGSIVIQDDDQDAFNAKVREKITELQRQTLDIEIHFSTAADAFGMVYTALVIWR